MRFGAAGDRDELAAFILDLDQTLGEGRMIVDAAVRWQPNAPRAERCRHRAFELAEKLVAARPGGIHPQVQRSALEQCGPFAGSDQGREFLRQPSGHRASRRHRLTLHYRLRTTRLSEQVEKRRIVSGKGEDSRTSAVRPFGNRPHCPKHKFAYCAAILRTGVAPRLEVARDEHVRGRPVVAGRFD